MTEKEYYIFLGIGLLLSVFIVGVGIGSLITGLRYDAEIRADQLDLQAQVDGVVKDKAVIDSLAKKLIFHIEQLELERERLHRLQIELSKGEKNVKN